MASCITAAELQFEKTKWHWPFGSTSIYRLKAAYANDLAQVELLHLVPQRIARDAQNSRSLGLIPIRLRQRLYQQPALLVGQRHAIVGRSLFGAIARNRRHHRGFGDRK